MSSEGWVQRSAVTPVNVSRRRGANRSRRICKKSDRKSKSLSIRQKRGKKKSKNRKNGPDHEIPNVISTSMMDNQAKSEMFQFLFD
ncbi:hypothetical protein ROHU_029203 [Labeo rohita]|uniref:Uncharacterized protein n=1 Tax=Labeo rohita TaxID=84645 RepID=A0A498LXW4_LABRO|nr:hypothetical protein ROHU_029203 [Labeo rohita]